MSAPRKIWAAPSKGNGWNVAFCSEVTPEDAKDLCDLYHHDDVLRELVEENARLSEQVESLSSSVGEWRSLAMDYVSKDPLYSSKEALAKIAQDA